MRNIVVTIDNVPRAADGVESAADHSRRPATFVTAGAEDTLVLAPENYARYEPFVALVLATSTRRRSCRSIAGSQPLFQQAYEELGHPDASFNDALDRGHRASARRRRRPRGEIALVQPSVLYATRTSGSRSCRPGRSC